MKKLNILVVEEDGAIRDLAKTILGEAGHSVRLAANAEQGLAIIEMLEGHGEHLDLIITDYQMRGGMNGIEFINAVRLLKVHTPAWIWSGAPEPNFSNLEWLGITGYITKPIWPETLRTTLVREFGSIPADAIEIIEA